MKASKTPQIPPPGPVDIKTIDPHQLVNVNQRQDGRFMAGIVLIPTTDKNYLWAFNTAGPSKGEE